MPIGPSWCGYFCDS